eukprot:jgi/Chlat1/2934/Chrsp2S04674
MGGSDRENDEDEVDYGEDEVEVEPAVNNDGYADVATISAIASRDEQHAAVANALSTSASRYGAEREEGEVSSSSDKESDEEDKHWKRRKRLRNNARASAVDTSARSEAKASNKEQKPEAVEPGGQQASAHRLPAAAQPHKAVGSAADQARAATTTAKTSAPTPTVMKPPVGNVTTGLRASASAYEPVTMHKSNQARPLSAQGHSGRPTPILQANNSTLPPYSMVHHHQMPPFLQQPAPMPLRDAGFIGRPMQVGNNLQHFRLMQHQPPFDGRQPAGGFDHEWGLPGPLPFGMGMGPMPHAGFAPNGQLLRPAFMPSHFQPPQRPPEYRFNSSEHPRSNMPPRSS